MVEFLGSGWYTFEKRCSDWREGDEMLNKDELLALISGGEGHTVEFKKSAIDITKDVYESICAFSNRDGGHIFLGIKDNGEILGIDPAYIGKMKKTL